MRPGYDDIIMETVGVGQAEVDIVGHADSVALVRSRARATRLRRSRRA